MHPRLLHRENPQMKRDSQKINVNWPFLSTYTSEFAIPIRNYCFYQYNFHGLKKYHLCEMWRPHTCSSFSSWQREVKKCSNCVICAYTTDFSLLVWVRIDRCCNEQCKTSAAAHNTRLVPIHGSPCHRPGWALLLAAVLRAAPCIQQHPYLLGWQSHHWTVYICQAAGEDPVWRPPGGYMGHAQKWWFYFAHLPLGRKGYLGVM